MTQAPPSPTAVLPPPSGGGSGMAIASIVLGVLGFCTGGLLAIVGLVLGIVAFSKAGKGGRRGSAIAGIVVSALAIVIAPVVLLAGLLLPAIGAARLEAQDLKAMSQLRQVGVAMAFYNADYQDRLPPADEWVDLLEVDYIGDPDMLVWPGRDPEGRVFAMNAALSGAVVSEIPSAEDTPLFFECMPGSPPAGGPELLPAKPHSRSYGYLVLFLDGRVEDVSPASISSLNWGGEP